MTMERRDFIKLSLGAMASGSLASCARTGITSEKQGLLEAAAGAAPRRCELLDADWRFREEWGQAAV